MSNTKSPYLNYSCLAFVGGAIAIAAVAVLCFHRGETVIPFKPLSPQAFLGLIGWLLAVALFVERAVEVVVCVCRDQGADAIAIKQKQATAQAVKADAAANAAGQSAGDALRQTSAAAHKSADDADPFDQPHRRFAENDREGRDDPSSGDGAGELPARGILLFHGKESKRVNARPDRP